MNIYQGNTYRKYLSWLYSSHITRVQKEAAREGTAVQHIRFCSLSNNSKQQLGAATQI